MARTFLLEPPPSPLPAARAFLRHARFRLRDDYLVKITAAMDELTDDQIWWRPNEASNSVGNLVLHLTGNLQQFIGVVLGGSKFVRDRDAEFRRRDVPRDELLGQIDATRAAVEREIGRAHV